MDRCQTYQHKSGSRKRKERAARLESIKQGQTLLSKFFVTHGDPSSSNTVDTIVSQHPDAGLTDASDSATTVTAESDHENVGDMPQNSSPIMATSYVSILSDESDIPLLESGSSDVSVSVPDSNMTENVPISVGQLHEFDTGQLEEVIPTPNQVNTAVRTGHLQHPSNFPRDETGRAFPQTLLHIQLNNGEKIVRDWLVWSVEKQSLFCFCCRMFYNGPEQSRPSLAQIQGINGNWRKLYEKIPQHQNSASHRSCYLMWRKLEKTIANSATIDMKLDQSIQSEVLQWKLILVRLLDIALFLAERGLPFRGVTEKLGDPHNGLFLGLCEFLARYDKVLELHLAAVREAQASHRRMQVSYLSKDTQNEFIECCASAVLRSLLKEVADSKYYAVIVDATPDTSSLEQNVFVLRYVYCNIEGQYEVQERFLDFVDNQRRHSKTGEVIASMILDTLKKQDIPFQNCRGQGYDNASNMTGVYKGVSTRLENENKLAKFSPCAAHSLNLCGTHAAECCPDVVTFFGVVQKVYAMFHGSPERWELLKDIISDSLHPFSSTRWSARIQSVRPFAANLPGLKTALESLLEFNLTAQAMADVKGFIKYISSFKCVLMSSIWFKALKMIDDRSKVLQAQSATIDIEVKNIDGLIRDLQNLKGKWPAILAECKAVAKALKIELWSVNPDKRKKRRKRFFDESDASDSDESEDDKDKGNLDDGPYDEFRLHVFEVLVDSLLTEMKNRYGVVRALEAKFAFLWKYLSMEEKIPATSNLVFRGIHCFFLCGSFE